MFLQSGATNEYPQSMFYINNKKKLFTPLNHPSAILKCVQGGIHNTDVLS